MKLFGFLIVSILIMLPIEAGQCWEETDSKPLSPIKLNAQGEFVPEWSKQVIWYQIFPERFRDGDATNTPTMQSIVGADPQDTPKHWRPHPWESDWYELQDYEKANAEPELWKHILRRRYGGDLQGIIDKLDYLQDLGVGAIYLNPVFHSPSHHKYDAISYHHIDPFLGPDPEGDLKLIASEKSLNSEDWVWTKADLLVLELIEKAHERGIKIIFDGVFNHLGANSFAFQDVLKNQQNSAYKDWFIVNSWRDNSKATEFKYQGWFGVQSLPEFKENDNGLVEGPRNYIFDATSRWMNPMNKGASYGIDGWRLDVAYCVSHRFWKDWRSKVKSINPDAYITAEIVAPKEQLKPYFQGDEFDGEMNYNFSFTAAEFFFNPEGKDNISASEFDQKLNDLRKTYPKGVAYATMNLFGSHDSNRLASHIVNRGIGNYRDWGDYFNTSIAMRNPNYSVRKPNANEIQLQKLFVLFQMTYVGAPMIYYGDEVGMWGGNDPSTRKPMLWSDIKYDNEIYNPDGSKRKPDEVSPNLSLKAHYKALMKIRNENPAFQVGEYKTILVSDSSALFGFERTYKDDSYWVILNNSDEARNITMKAPSANQVKVLFGEEVTQNGSTVEIILAARSGIILKL